MSINATNAHQFAFWYAELSDALQPNKHELIIRDATLIGRIANIVRLRVGEPCILFNRAIHVSCIIRGIESKSIRMTCELIEKNHLYEPTITALLPLLKKDDLSSAVAALTAVGVSRIQLLAAESMQRNRWDAHDNVRLERIMIAAAEQSKNFSIPQLSAPLALADALAEHSTIIWGDVAGRPYADVLRALPQKIEACAVVVGPEADFTAAEKKILHARGAHACLLTPTVLRAHLAITILAATVRSWYHR